MPSSAIGTASEGSDLAGRVGLSLAAGFVIAVALWWLHFDVVATVAEQTLRRAAPEERVRLARDSYTSLHLPMIGGVAFAAMGMLLLIADHGHLDGGRYALFGGVISYLAAHLAFRLRNVGSVNWARAATIVILALEMLALRGQDPTLSIVVAAVTLAALVGFEAVRYAGARDAVRHGPHA